MQLDNSSYAWPCGSAFIRARQATGRLRSAARVATSSLSHGSSLAAAEPVHVRSARTLSEARLKANRPLGGHGAGLLRHPAFTLSLVNATQVREQSKWRQPSSGSRLKMIALS